MTAASDTKRRFFYLVAVILVIFLGLASRKYPALFPAILGKYPGDALWALMVFFGWGIVFPTARPSKLAAYALLTSYAVEFSQIYQAPWLNAIRATTCGHLILGSGFQWTDLAAYTVGVSCGVVLLLSLQKQHRNA